MAATKADMAATNGWHGGRGGARHDAQEVPHFGRGHVGERVELDQAAGAAVGALERGVDLHHRHRRARAGALVLALAGDPGAQAGQLPPQRPHLRPARLASAPALPGRRPVP